MRAECAQHDKSIKYTIQENIVTHMHESVWWQFFIDFCRMNEEHGISMNNISQTTNVHMKYKWCK